MIHIAGFEGKGGHKPKIVNSLKNLEEAGNEFSPRTSRKKYSPVHNLILAKWEPCLISDFQNYKVENVHCFKLLICGNLPQK